MGDGVASTILVEFKAPAELVETYDRVVRSLGYTSRAEALREHMRNLVMKHAKGDRT